MKKNTQPDTNEDIGHTLFWWLFIGVTAVALFVRLYDISLRPFHSDEGVNFHFIKSIIREGYYQYSHENYHGPAYFYLTFFLTRIFGVNDLGMRMSAILMGWGLLPLLLLLLRTESRLFVLSAAALLATSSSQVFYSRYTIHEPLFVFSGFLIGLSVFLWHKTRDPRYHYLTGLGLGLIIATKETFIITLFCIFFAFVALGDWRLVLLDLRRQYAAFIGGLFITACTLLFIFTGGLQWPGGLREMFLAVPQWIGRNESDVGHFKPFHYYTHIILGREPLEALSDLLDLDLFLNKHFAGPAEPQFALLILIPLVTILCVPSRLALLTTPETRTGRFFAVWAFLAWLVYSSVNYKTPWLIVNITAPACMLLAWTIWRIGSLPQTGARYLRGGILLLAVAITTYAAYVYNLRIPFGQANPYSYVHTHAGMMQLLNDIETETARIGSRRVLVGTKHYWPLPYYLRNHAGAIGYQKTDEIGPLADKYDILILDSSVSWSEPGWVRRYYRLSDIQEAHVFFRR